MALVSLAIHALTVHILVVRHQSHLIPHKAAAAIVAENGLLLMVMVNMGIVLQLMLAHSVDAMLHLPPRQMMIMHHLAVVLILNCLFDLNCLTRDLIWNWSDIEAYW